MHFAEVCTDVVVAADTTSGNNAARLRIEIRKILAKVVIVFNHLLRPSIAHPYPSSVRHPPTRVVSRFAGFGRMGFRATGSPWTAECAPMAAGVGGEQWSHMVDELERFVEKRQHRGEHAACSLRPWRRGCSRCRAGARTPRRRPGDDPISLSAGYRARMRKFATAARRPSAIAPRSCSRLILRQHRICDWRISPVHVPTLSPRTTPNPPPRAGTKTPVPVRVPRRS